MAASPSAQGRGRRQARGARGQEFRRSLLRPGRGRSSEPPWAAAAGPCTAGPARAALRGRERRRGERRALGPALPAPGPAPCRLRAAGRRTSDERACLRAAGVSRISRSAAWPRAPVGRNPGWQRCSAVVLSCAVPRWVRIGVPGRCAASAGRAPVLRCLARLGPPTSVSGLGFGGPESDLPCRSSQAAERGCGPTRPLARYRPWWRDDRQHWHLRLPQEQGPVAALAALVAARLSAWARSPLTLVAAERLSGLASASGPKAARQQPRSLGRAPGLAREACARSEASHIVVHEPPSYLQARTSPGARAGRSRGPWGSARAPAAHWPGAAGTAVTGRGARCVPMP